MARPLGACGALLLIRMDREEGLTADRLIDNFNDVSHFYDLMRDLEWEALKASQVDAG